LPIHLTSPCTGTAATSYASPSGFRVAFLGFGLEAVVNTNTGYAKRWTVIQRALDFLSSSQMTDVEDDFTGLPLPRAFELSQNFPNPFDPTTMIPYEIGPRASGQNLSLDVYNILGEKVATLVSGIARPGTYMAEFDAANEPSGVYLYRLSVGSETITKKMVLTK